MQDRRLFNTHLAGVALSNLADGILAGAVPLVAISLTRDPLLVGLISTSMWLPWLLGALLVGVFVDRTDRAQVRRRALLARACVLAGALAIVAADLLTIWALLGVILAYAVTEVVSDLAASALIPQLVGPDDLAHANSRVMGVERLMQSFLGAPLGGALVALASASAFGAAAGLVAVAVVVLTRLRRPGGFRAPSEEGSAPSVRAEIMEGLRLVATHRVVRPLVVMAVLSNFASTAYFSVFVLWAVGEGSAIGLKEWQYPILPAVLTAGALLGTLVPRRWVRRAGEVRLMTTGLLVNGLGLFVPFLVPTWWAVAATFLVLGASNMIGNVILMSIRQRVVPGRLLGRVGGASATLAYGVMAIAGPVGGLLARATSLGVVFVSMAAVASLTAVWLMTRLRQRDVDAAGVPAAPPIPSASGPRAADRSRTLDPRA
ncbi:MFS transporter [Tessaracoccus oleiagri]|uniref:Predicted arabinose efflux permease, MFS family n=1 Tax=Tessaracoccus oleiagri TaxID=686624 RepID=A0A1G9HNA7_9ACTN|nr:MFS transporter [Tessaracoccus oleiagri]SDL14448.1 Predicted arabinose efflux permease, MFS family [Tessaracoccus oleiagri]